MGTRGGEGGAGISVVWASSLEVDLMDHRRSRRRRPVPAFELAEADEALDELSSDGTQLGRGKTEPWAGIGPSGRGWTCLILGSLNKYAWAETSAQGTIVYAEKRDLLQSWKVKNMAYAARSMKLKPRLMARRFASSSPSGTPCRRAVLTT